MLYLFALIGMITVVAVLWAAFGPRRDGEPQARPRQVGPDDDPEFLRRLNEQRRDDGPPQK